MTCDVRLFGAGIKGMMKHCAALAGLVLISGCQLSLDDIPSIKTGRAKSVAFASGVTVAAPDGFCAQPSLTRDKGSRGFAVFTPCQTSSTGGAMVTVSVLPVGDDTAPTYKAMQRQFISASKPKEHFEYNGIHFAKLNDAQVTAPLGMGAEYWRALALRENALVLANYYEPEGRNMSEAKAKTVMVNLFEKFPPPRDAAPRPLANSTPAAASPVVVGYLPTAPLPKPRYRP